MSGCDIQTDSPSDKIKRDDKIYQQNLLVDRYTESDTEHCDEYKTREMDENDHDEDTNCDHCSKQFYTTEDLVNHIKTQHVYFYQESLAQMKRSGLF